MKMLFAATALMLAATPALAQGAAPAGGCLVRFTALLDSVTGLAFNAPQGSVLTPVYVLAAKDCPATASGIDEYAAEWSDGAVTSRAGLSSSTANKTPRHEAGKRMVAAFGTWLSGRSVNAKVATIRKVGTMIVLPATPFNRERYAKDVGATTYFLEKPGPGGTKQIVPANAKWGPTQTACLDYAPAGITPLEVLGRENCKVWLR